MVFIAELFWWFEIVKPEFVQPRDVQEFKDGEECFGCRIDKVSDCDVNICWICSGYTWLKIK